MTGPVFEVGETYSARSAVDADTVFQFTVTARTAKFVTVEHDGRSSRVGVLDGPDGEWAKPLGTYSMCPVIRASRPDSAKVCADIDNTAETVAARRSMFVGFGWTS
jgi:hypothetical protein